MKVQRLFEIIYLLMHRSQLTAGELAAHFEVSKRTILRDVETLSAAGIPIYTSPGKGGGIALLDGFVLNKTLITAAEQAEILTALESQAATGMETKRLIAKLRALFNEPAGDWLAVDFSRWGSRAADSKRFEALKEAVLTQRVLRFNYVGTNGQESERLVYPLRLVFKGKAWYLQGFCCDRRDYRTFKINRMLDIQVTDEFFDATPYEVPPITEGSAPSPLLTTVTLSFAPELAYRVYDGFDENAVERYDDGSLYVRATLPADDWLYGFLLSCRDGVTVIDPPAVKNKLASLR